MDPPFGRAIADNVVATCRLGTDLMGRWVATGTVISESDAAQVARVGETAAHISTSLLDVTRTYLAWREHTLRVVAEESDRLGAAPALVQEVRAVVHRASAVSLMDMVRRFDAERRELQRRLDAERASLVHLATHDPLTVLANRSLLLGRLRDALEDARQNESDVAVLFLDLDGFKGVNDEMGHDVGDRLLVAIAARLIRMVRASDTVARLGGDEFVVVCADMVDARPDAARVAERVRVRFAEPFPVGPSITVSASVGVVLATPGSTPERVLSQADEAMYAVKHTRTLAAR